MKKAFFISSIFLIIICGCGVFIYIYSAPILAKMLSFQMQTSVKIDHIEWGPQSCILFDLQIDNPQETQLPIALKAKTLAIHTPYKNYIKDPIIINKIHLDTIYINIQLYTKDHAKGNWQTLIDNMQRKHKVSLSTNRVGIIKKLILTNIQVDLILADGSHHTLSPIDILEFDDIHSDKGVPMQKISEIIAKHMMDSIFIIKGLKALFKLPIIKQILPLILGEDPE